MPIAFERHLALRAWAATLTVYYHSIVQSKPLISSIFAINLRLQGHHPGGQGRTGARLSDQPFLIFWFFLIKQKER